MVESALPVDHIHIKGTIQVWRTENGWDGGGADVRSMAQILSQPDRAACQCTDTQARSFLAAEADRTVVPSSSQSVGT